MGGRTSRKSEGKRRTVTKFTWPPDLFLVIDLLRRKQREAERAAFEAETAARAERRRLDREVSEVLTEIKGSATSLTNSAPETGKLEEPKPAGTTDATPLASSDEEATEAKEKAERERKWKAEEEEEARKQKEEEEEKKRKEEADKKEEELQRQREEEERKLKEQQQKAEEDEKTKEQEAEAAALRQKEEAKKKEEEEAQTKVLPIVFSLSWVLGVLLPSFFLSQP